MTAQFFILQSEDIVVALDDSKPLLVAVCSKALVEGSRSQWGNHPATAVKTQVNPR